MMLVVYLAVQSVIEFIGLQGVNGIAAAGFVAQQHYEDKSEQLLPCIE